jgi:hypothetical protein
MPAGGRGRRALFCCSAARCSFPPAADAKVSNVARCCTPSRAFHSQELVSYYSLLTPLGAMSSSSGGAHADCPQDVLAAAARLLEDDSLHDVTFYCGRDGGASRGLASWRACARRLAQLRHTAPAPHGSSSTAKAATTGDRRRGMRPKAEGWRARSAFRKSARAALAAAGACAHTRRWLAARPAPCGRPPHALPARPLQAWSPATRPIWRRAASTFGCYSPLRGRRVSRAAVLHKQYKESPLLCQHVEPPGEPPPPLWPSNQAVLAAACQQPPRLASAADACSCA